MCGIAGASRQNIENVRDVLISISHRGPDGRNFFQDSGVTLCHTLLSTRGQASDITQPSHTACGRWVFVFNGQIYNTDWIVKLLNMQHLREKSDTLILSHLIHKYGKKFVRFIDGMFAIVLFDKKDRTLHLYRDQSGQKNLYYRFHRGDLFFASELEALLSLTRFAPNVANESSISFGAHLGYWPGSETIIRDAYRLLPGQILEYRITDKSHETSFIGTSDYSEKTNENFNFQNSMASVFATNCEVSLNLSGGMDSSVILHELSKAHSDVRTYTTIYKDCSVEANSEAVLAKELSKYYGTNHLEFEVSRESYIESFVESYGVLDEPNYNISVPVYNLLAKFQGSGEPSERVLFSGDGGDEIFWGYPHYERSYQIDRLSKIISSPLLSKLYKFKRGRQVKFDDPIERWLFFKFWKNSFLETRITEKEMSDKLKQEFDFLKEKFAHNNHNCHSTMIADRFFWLAGENFTRVDKIYMNQSIEVRLPFALPSTVHSLDEKIREERNISGKLKKRELREVYSDVLPDFITKRMGKVGWRGPLEEWYNTDMKCMFLDILPNQNSELVNWKKIREKIEFSNEWPGKQAHFYLSLAILGQKFKISI